jgi:hypothetical protein
LIHQEYEKFSSTYFDHSFGGLCRTSSFGPTTTTTHESHLGTHRRGLEPAACSRRRVGRLQGLEKVKRGLSKKPLPKGAAFSFKIQNSRFKMMLALRASTE